MGDINCFTRWKNYIRLNNEKLQSVLHLTSSLLHRFECEEIITQPEYTEMEKMNEGDQFIKFYNIMNNSPDRFANKKTLIRLGSILRSDRFRRHGAASIFETFCIDNQDILPYSIRPTTLITSLSKPPGMVQDFNFDISLPVEISNFHHSLRINVLTNIFEAFYYMDGRIPRPRVVVIAGMPGMGKTTLVKQYADKHKGRKDTYTNFVRINASDDDILKHDLVNLAAELNVSSAHGRRKTAKNIFSLLGNYKSLIFFHNVKSKESLQAVIPKYTHPNLHFIATTESLSWKLKLPLECIHMTVAQQHMVQIQNSAVEYLVQRLEPLGCTNEDAERLARRFEWHVEALETTCEVLENSNGLPSLSPPFIANMYTVSDLLEKIGFADPILAALRVSDNPFKPHEVLLKNLRSIWDLSFQRLTNDTNVIPVSATKILRFIVQQQLPSVPYERVDTFTGSEEIDRDTAREAFNHLTNVSLIKPRNDPDPQVELHPLVRDAASSVLL